MTPDEQTALTTRIFNHATAEAEKVAPEIAVVTIVAYVRNSTISAHIESSMKPIAMIEMLEKTIEKMKAEERERN